VLPIGGRCCGPFGVAGSLARGCLDGLGFRLELLRGGAGGWGRVVAREAGDSKPAASCSSDGGFAGCNRIEQGERQRAAQGASAAARAGHHFEAAFE